VILKALSDHAKQVGLVEGMAIKHRLVHLILRIDTDGQVFAPAPWIVLTRPILDPKKGTTREEPGKALPMPEYPGVNAGGKAHFLADSAEKVLGLLGKSGEPVPDDGKNAAKAFEHYWKRIADAHVETKAPELAALLKFRERYLAVADRKGSLEAIVGIVPVGKETRLTFSARTSQGPFPLEGRTITFRVGSSNSHIFADGSPLRDYWASQFRRERFADSPADPATGRGTCLVTGETNVPIAEVHRTPIKGVPGLPPIGGYLVSFGDETPSLRSYGFEKGWNSPVSEDAALAYALGLNSLLADKNTRKKLGDSVLCSWVDIDPEAGGVFLDLLDAPSADSRSKFFQEFETGRFAHAFQAGHYRSLTLAANGGRVVVRRWLDEPLREVVKAVRRWFDDLETEAIAIPRAASKVAGRKSSKTASPDPPSPEAPTFNPLAIHALAAVTARVPSEVQTTTYDALYQAAHDPSRFRPGSLLAPVLGRLRIAAAQRGNGVRFDTSRFALLKLILLRSGDQPMAVDRFLCETNDKPYNCGRLLAVLDDLQRAAQGQVGADIVSRFYGAASTYPKTVFGRLMDLAQHHKKKLAKSSDPRQRSKGWALMARVNDISAKFGPAEGRDTPDFPALLTPEQQARFALGFHQQKAADDRAIKKYLADKAAGKADADPILAALAEVRPGAENAPE